MFHSPLELGIAGEEVVKAQVAIDGARVDRVDTHRVDLDRGGEGAGV
jgi:hypothetical protein